MFEFALPDLGEGIHEGEILKWYVAPGETIQEDDPLVDVETDKAAITIPSPRSGTIASRQGDVGDTVLVGDVIIVIDDGTGPAEPAMVAAGAEASEKATAVVTASATTSAAGTQVNTSAHAAGVDAPSGPAVPWGRVVAVPATRRLARELKIDIRHVPPTGSGGRVTREDVNRFADQGGASSPTTEPATPQDHERRTNVKAAATAAGTIPFLDIEPLPDFEQWGPVEIEPLRSIRRKVARKMVTSMVLVPHVAHMDDADVTLLEQFRRQERERRTGKPGGRLTLLSFVIKAVTAGLRAAPSFNASLDAFKEEIVYKKYYNIGIAVDTGHGLVVPVIRDTDRKSILEISTEIEEVAAKARDGSLSATDFRGGTFTITNVGPLGGTALIPTINYPEVAILGMGRARDKPVVVDGKIVIRTILPLTLAFDHRVADGADAARFVTEMVRQLSDPNLLLLET